MDSDLGEMVFAAEKISKKRLRKGKGESFYLSFFITVEITFSFQLSTWSNGKVGDPNTPPGNLKKTFLTPD